MFFLKIEKKAIFDFFSICSLEGLLSESSGHSLNCNIFEYLMIYQFDFTDIINNTVPYISKIFLSLSDVLMMAHINNLEKRIPQKYSEPKI